MSVFTSAVLQGLNAVDGLKVRADWAEYDPKNSILTAYDCSANVFSSELVMQRILFRLGKADIVTVKRGPGGGFSITEEQLRTKRVLDVLEALGQPCVAPEGSRASDRLQQVFHDVMNVSLEDFFASSGLKEWSY